MRPVLGEQDQRRAGRKATKQELLLSVAPSRGPVLHLRRKREAAEQAKCLKYMTGVI